MLLIVAIEKYQAALGVRFGSSHMVFGKNKRNRFDNGAIIWHHTQRNET
jgi:hypothetical protein